MARLDREDICWVVFEALGGLVWRSPGEMAAFKIRCARAGIVLTPEQAQQAWSRAQQWALGQELRETRGGERLGDQVFELAKDRAALQAVLPADQIEGAALALAHAPAPLVRWEPDRDAGVLLDALRAAGLRIGAVSHFSPGLEGLLASEGLGDVVEALGEARAADVPPVDPSIISAVLERSRADGEEVLYVGAHAVALTVVRGAGAQGVWLDREQCAPWPEQLPAPEGTVTGLREVGALLGLEVVTGAKGRQPLGPSPQRRPPGDRGRRRGGGPRRGRRPSQ